MKSGISILKHIQNKLNKKEVSTNRNIVLDDINTITFDEILN
jgi:hypothetical protein